MAIFGDDKGAELAALRDQLQASAGKHKQLASALQAERQASAQLRIELGKANAQLEEMKRQVGKARERQRASVERANRFKARLQSTASD